MDDSQYANDIAVIGMACRLPGAADPVAFWANLRDGVESIERLDDAALLAAGESPAHLGDPAYVKAAPVLADIDKFDAAFFGWSPRDAAVTDPQHRLFLETAWAAFEDAGYDPRNCAGPVAVYATCGMNSYMMYHLVTNREVMDTLGEWLVRHSGNDPNFLATRTSYELNLTGPSMNVQTACSSSLVAIHLACQSLLNGECELALAGGATVVLPADRGYLYKEGEILSPDGHCRPFDAQSAGTLFGSGTGCVILKRLSAALADGDHVVAVIKGSAVNNDGSQKVGYLAPSVEGQAQAVAEALAVSGVDPETISYVEAHGTGTAIGDPIEIAALTQAYRAGGEHPDRNGYCAIGSLKSNLGHLGEAAGVAGFIKTALALAHRQIPPSLHYSAPNPQIDFANSPFFVNTRLADWASAPGMPRRAGVTALGAGGTNVHAVLEEAPPSKPGGPARAWQLLTLSAKSEAALDRASARLADHLAQHPQLALADVAFTLQTGRRAFAHRRVLAARDAADAAQALRTGDPKRVFTAHAATKGDASVVFMFPGGGAQYAGMGAELYATEPVYREAIDQCCEAVRASLDLDLRTLMFPAAGAETDATERLERPSLALPALFATEYALARLLMSWGIQPAAMIGHSMGEYVAACLAGVFSYRTGMELVALRGRLFEQVPAGGMLSVSLAEAQARELMAPGLSFAAINAPELCVVSGPVEAIAATEQRLAAREIDATRIHIAVAAHSEMLDAILPEFERFCRGIAFEPPTLPYLSNLTGRWISAAEATDPGYWVRHLRHTVRFSDGLAELLVDPNRVLLEVGPGRTLSSLARQQPAKPMNALSTLRHPKEAGSDLAFLFNTVGKIWLCGIAPDWPALHGGVRRLRVPLPTYPFERKRHWIAAGNPLVHAAAQSRHDATLRKKPDVGDWFHLPAWRRALPPTTQPTTAADRGWLVFADAGGFAERLAARLPGAIVVQAGAAFAQSGPRSYSLRPHERGDYDQLVRALQGRLPSRVLHLWALGEAPANGAAEIDDARYFDSLLFLAQALANDDGAFDLTVVASGMQQLAGESLPLVPTKALLLGPCRVIPREFALIKTRVVDVVVPSAGSWQEQRLLDQLSTELAAPPAERIVAWRGAERWVQRFEPAVLPQPARRDWLREGGVYLITGGLGGIGLELARHLAQAARVKLVLVGRTSIPARERWPALRAAGDAMAGKLQQLEALEALGAELALASADVTNIDQMRDVVARTVARFGALNGVFHAAGTIADELIVMKSRESARAVIAPKVQGALVLDAALRGIEHDFLVLFSSVSAILGLQGQVDYTAANAFLDAFAHERSMRERSRTVAINWSAWQDVGMAAAISAQQAQRAPHAVHGEGEATRHPWLARRHASGAEAVFVTTFDRAAQWLVGEHVIRGGDALIPGTGYLELARAALEECADPAPTMAASGAPRPRWVEIRDVFFVAPFAVRAGEPRELRLTLQRTGGEFAVTSTLAGDGSAHAVTHVTGKVVHVDASGELPPRADIAALRSRCSERVESLNGSMDQRFMDFGPRWANLEAIHYGRDEALVALNLAAAFQADLEAYPLHPALLDMATGAAQGLIPGFDRTRDFFVPFSYGRVLMRGPLPARLFSHVRSVPGGDRSTAVFRISLLDEHGAECVAIDEFVMRRVDEPLAMTQATTSAVPSAAAAHAAAAALAVFREGMRVAEGMDALDRILGAATGPQIVASSIDLLDWLAATDSSAAASGSPDDAESPQASTGATSAAARPALSAPYVAPRDDLERSIAAIWHKMLGIAEIGVHDDFFEAGGHSLLLTQTVTRIRKMADVDVSLRSLFAKPTIADIADEIRKAQAQPQQAAAKPAPALVAVSRENYRVRS
ncbi:MAG TPA: SDR family NAD(P)-dependent oxidoreductase [Burkholderiaceae bacterium]|nr:SDR family NAD(P)-dependent oxidoreductase [Burkholderiaceae bacterium]